MDQYTMSWIREQVKIFRQTPTYESKNFNRFENPKFLKRFRRKFFEKTSSFPICPLNNIGEGISNVSKFSRSKFWWSDIWGRKIRGVDI